MEFEGLLADWGADLSPSGYIKIRLELRNASMNVPLSYEMDELMTKIVKITIDEA